MDTNVLASGATISSTPPGQIIDSWRAGAFELILSEFIIDELERTFQKQYFQKHLSTLDVAVFIDLLKNEATITPITAKVEGIATHPEDDVILATAVSSRSDYLVTGDNHFLHKVGIVYQGVTLLTPNDFLKALLQ